MKMLRRHNSILLHVARRYESVTKEVQQVISLAAQGEQKTLTARILSLSKRLDTLGLGAAKDLAAHEESTSMSERKSAP